MKLSEIKEHLKGLETIAFQLPDGSLVEEHFHVTEVGEVTKHFIDCGGTVRHEKVANFQLWSANDYNHRLHPEKLVKIIELSEKTLGLGDLDIEVEYQGTSIMKFGLDFDGTNFLLTSKQTDCLAKDACGIPEKAKVSLVGAVTAATGGCTPGGGCC
ncbi:DUF6428 family protein [Jiulongibacter sp. NS-SX5]|uniref:DUF6428 family protein n=1 Tax=Jiulongibacter sp. NS-SX5 TaxID=3463854 RepID=UPI004058A764